jgi:phenylpyruvate decarboxylase
MTLDKQIQKVQLGTYIFERLSQIKHFRSVFGVPGDFNLALLEHIYNVPKLNWIGNCNELNAGYAADGYAKVNGIGALITTFGVGELSALNAISGAWTEGAAVLHIVGTSTTSSKRSNQLAVHHLIPNKNTWDHTQDHTVYERIVEPFSCVIETLSDENLDKVQEQVDNAIEQVFKHSRPGYLFIPANMANMNITIDVNKKLNFNLYHSEKEQAQELAQRVLDRLYGSKFAVVADQWFKKRRCQLNKFIQNNELHCFVTILGKSIIDESYDKFHGVLAGKLSTEGSLDVLKQFDSVLSFGVNHNEMNNFQNWHLTDVVSEVTEIGKDYIRIDGELITHVDGELVFDEMMKALDSSKLLKSSVTPRPTIPATAFDKNAPVKQSSLLTTIQSTLKNDDVLVSEMCSFLFSVPDLKMPSGLTFVSQNFYGSIGYALPATLGASLAVKDSGSKRRVILVEGDGSSQMTIQELSSLLRYNVKPTVLLLNNEGYSVERIVMGPTRAYNDIQPNWQWTNLLKCFGDIDGKSASTRVDSIAELEKAINTEEDKLKFIEVGLEKMDVPWRFGYLCAKGN